MKTTSKTLKALEDVWRWREMLIARAGEQGKTVEAQMRAISRLGDEAAKRYGFESVGLKAERVAEAAGVVYGAAQRIPIQLVEEVATKISRATPNAATIRD